MFKEIPKKIVDYKLEIGPLITSKSVKMKFLSYKDTIKTSSSELQQTLPELKKPNITKSDTGNHQSKTIYSVTLKSPQTIYNSIVEEHKNQNSTTLGAVDTSSTRIYNEKLPFQANKSNANEPYSTNFLLAIPHKNISDHFVDLLITKQRQTSPVLEKNNQIIVQSSVVTKEHRFQGQLRTEASLDWLPFIILLSLFTFSWIKLLYQKYIVQVVTSLINYQVSIRLLRERNVLFRNMALGLNFVFSINIGLFIFFYIQYHNLNQIHSSHFLSMVIYSLAVIMLYNIKTASCKLIGNIFLVKEHFGEYVHNIHLNNKNIGLFLFPIIIVFPYITNNQVKPIVLYLGLTIIIGMFLLLIYRGFQIIMRNGVSTFYLILYLCAIEILPVLLLIKYSYTLI